MDSPLGPLSKKYCVLFSYFSLFTFFLLMISFLGGVYVILTKKGLNYKEYVGIIYAVVMSFVVYLQNRLLYNMCINSLK